MEESLLLDFPNEECVPLPDSPLFNSEAEAFGWAQRQASTSGYTFSSLYKNKSKFTGDIIFSCYNCDKGPKIYQNKPKITSKSKQRDGTGSKKCGCQYKITIKLNESKKWVIIPKNSHDHGRNSTSIAHPAHRIAALQNTLRAEILNAAKSGLNIIPKERQKQLGGMTPMQRLLKELQDNGYNPRFETKDGNILSKLMYLHPQAIQLWKNHPDALLMDWTYKKNRFKMPLKNICGATGGNKVIQFGPSATEADYDIRCYQGTFIYPHRQRTCFDEVFRSSFLRYTATALSVACQHEFSCKIKEAFSETNYKGDSYVRSPDFVEFLEQWNAVFAATSEEIYEQEVAKLKAMAMAPKDAYIYVERTWLDYLRRSTYDLKGVYDKLLLFWAAQKSSIADTEAHDQQKPRHNTSHPILSNLIGRIHNYALQKLFLEIRKMPLVTEQVPPCLCYLQEKRQLDKTDLHPHWWFKRNVAQNINMGIDFLDPEIISTRGQPRGALGGVSREAESSTRSNPSEFEHIIQEERSEAFRGRRRGQGPQRRDNSTINTSFSPLVVSTSLSTIPTRAQKRKREFEDETFHVASRAPLYRRVSRSTTAPGIVRLEACGEIYEPETTSERSSAMALSIIWRDGHFDEPDVITATLCAMGADDEVQDETTISDDGREVTVTKSI
ncbi:hypothetical protein K3495_g3010 [Podosphaera aphanis]|nr:hypothetical protein K3495_g3010 [Podosphaera aphanis]